MAISSRAEAIIMKVDTYPRVRDLSYELLKFLYDHYFRVDAHGLEHLPQKGAGMIVANHSGQLPFDAAMVSVAAATNPFGKRNVQVLLGEWLDNSPLICKLMKKMGAKTCNTSVVRRLIEKKQIVVYFPEGVSGAGKPFQQRYQLKRFKDDFFRLAVELNIPIIPAAIVGCEEVMPTISHWPWMADRLKIPYFPIAFPWPLPTKVHLYFGEPMTFSGDLNDADWVKSSVQQVQHQVRTLLGRGLVERDGWFS